MSLALSAAGRGLQPVSLPSVPPPAPPLLLSFELSRLLSGSVLPPAGNHAPWLAPHERRFAVGVWRGLATPSCEPLASRRCFTSPPSSLPALAPTSTPLLRSSWEGGLGSPRESPGVGRQPGVCFWGKRGLLRSHRLSQAVCPCSDPGGDSEHNASLPGKERGRALDRT